MRIFSILTCSFVLTLTCLTSALVAVEVQAVEVASGLQFPVGVTYAPGDGSRLFVIERNSGLVRVLKDDGAGGYNVLATPFFDVGQHDPNKRRGGESGVLGIAFSPDYQSSGVFFIRYNTDRDGGIKDVLLRCTVSGNPDVANEIAREILVIDDPRGNHNGGWIGFGPDGYLYTSYGDGGFQYDGLNESDPSSSGHGTKGNAQATDNLLGDIIRIDVGDGFGAAGQPPYGVPGDNPVLPGRDNNGNPSTARPEILHYGLRNPWRCSFDRATGDLWIGDVGQREIEEINVAADGAKGLNFGWRMMEGNSCIDDENAVPCGDSSLIGPVYEHLHPGGESGAIIGGYVYRGTAFPELDGVYFFADYPSARLYSFEYNGTTATNLVNRTSELGSVQVSSFGEDLNGEVYFCDMPNGKVFRIESAAGPAVPPTITTTAPLAANIGEEYIYNVNASGTDPIAFSLDQSPAGMTINSGNGIIRWTPGSAGSVDVTVRASNAADPDDTQSWVIGVGSLRPADNPNESISGGLDVAVFEGAWNTVPDFRGLTAVHAQTTGRPNVRARTRDTDFAQRFSGFLDVPTSGQWTLSFDGSYGMGPILHWPFDEGSGTIASDLANNYDGSVSAAMWDTGRYGGGLDFSNIDGEQVLSTAAGAAINGLDALTIALWVKSNSVRSNRGFFSGKEPSGGDDTLSMRYDSRGNAGGGTNVLKFGLTTTAGNYQYESASNAQTTDWQHVVLTWESGGTIEVYLDGVLDTPTNSVAAVINGEISGVNRVLVGRGSKDRSGSWNGLLDDVRVYPYKVSAGDVISLMGNSHPAAAGSAHAQLSIGDQVVVDTQISEVGSIGLAAGRHQVVVGMTQRVLDGSFAVSWTGPGVDGVERVPNANWDRLTNNYGLDFEPSAVPYLNMPTSEGGAIPSLLSATGVFSDVVSLTPAPGVVPYNVNTPLWSDAADKTRWIAVPDGERITYRRTGNWDFPAGTVLVKHFAIGSEARPIETRLIVVGDSGQYGVTYRWNDTFTDAELLSAGGLTEEITFDGTQTQTWTYPSRTDCTSCHTPAAGGVLGVRTRQQNGTMTYGSTGRSDNQLRTWNHLGYFHVDVDDTEIQSAPALASLSDDSHNLEHRSRSYLDSNCMFCHQPAGSAPTAFDLRYDTPLASQGIIGGEVINDLGIAGAQVVAPGDSSRSILYQRLHTTVEAIRMPPIGRTLRDDQALAVLDSWINSLDPGDQVAYQAGTVEVNQPDAETWQSINFAAPIPDPIVVAKIMTFGGAHPSTVRVRNITDTGFEFQMDEWDYLDGGHGRETIAWFAVTQGEATLTDGRTLVAGRSLVADSWTAISHGVNLTNPVVVAQVSSVSDPTAATVRLRSITGDGFDARLQSQELNNRSHGSEQVDWIALESGASVIETIKTGNSVTQNWAPLVAVAGGDHAILASMQTTDGGDTAEVRMRENAGVIEVMIEEEQSANSEINHTTEEVGALRIPVGVSNPSALGDG